LVRNKPPFLCPAPTPATSDVVTHGHRHPDISESAAADLDIGLDRRQLDSAASRSTRPPPPAATRVVYQFKKLLADRQGKVVGVESRPGRDGGGRRGDGTERRPSLGRTREDRRDGGDRGEARGRRDVVAAWPPDATARWTMDGIGEGWEYRMGFYGIWI
jgi:hypothetical protein